MALAALASGLVVSVLGVIVLGGGPGLWLNTRALAHSVNDKVVVKQLERLRADAAAARGRREAIGDLARGDLRIKLVGLQPPWFATFQKTAINTYGVGYDQLGCVINGELLAYVRAYNEESMKVISVKVGEATLDAAERAAEAEWVQKKPGASKSSARLRGTKPNYWLKLPVRPVTGLACARPAPDRPAA